MACENFSLPADQHEVFPPAQINLHSLLEVLCRKGFVTLSLESVSHVGGCSYEERSSRPGNELDADGFLQDR
jgi:hypothetical protein